MSEQSEVFRRLQLAIGTGEIVSILYNGGSQAGAHREILPLQINGSQVRARCYTSGAVKTFVLDKIEVLGSPVTKGDGSQIWDPTKRPEPPQTMAEIEAAHRAPLEAIGWHVALETRDGGEFLALYRRKKTGGGLMKHPTIVLEFEPITSDPVILPTGEVERVNHRPRIRPWGVHSRTKSCGTWGAPPKALEAFLREAATYP